ncbi:zinc finger BED domain-containing protein 5-like [Macrobrachium rosenbergii]|uniref:zinc finger BED domain-containing protein 5-like n=1 Tax=Macrobrachium rosenbergii TaxID=79674 RepID=UPI0034D79E82
MTLVKTKNLDIITMHYLIHREALASKTLPAPLKDTLETVIRIVNYIKEGALNTRLFRRLCQDMDSAHQDDLFYTSVCWLSKDVSEAFNGLNRQLQGPDTTIIMHTDAIKAFLDKNENVQLTLARNPFQCTVDDLPDDIQEEFLELINNTAAKEEFQEQQQLNSSNCWVKMLSAFPKTSKYALKLTLARNPFQCTVDDFPDDIQEEFLEPINNTAAKEEFQEQQQLNSSNCWVKMLSAFPKTSKYTLKVLIPFSSTYLCESGFSSFLVIKSKAINRLNAEADMRCALSHTDPRIDLLVAKKSCKWRAEELKTRPRYKQEGMTTSRGRRQEGLNTFLRHWNVGSLLHLVSNVEGLGTSHHKQEGLAASLRFGQDKILWRRVRGI